MSRIDRIGIDSNILLSPESGEGNGNGKADDQGDANKGGDPERLKGLQSLLEKNKGDGSAVAALLYSENYQHREKIRQLEGRLPGEGTLVLTPEEAKAWRHFSQLGDVKAVKADLETGRAAAAWKADHERTEGLKAAARDAGFAPDVFARLAKQDGVETVTTESKGKDGKDVRTVLVKGEGDKTTPVDEYAARHWAEFLPALKPAAGTASRRPETPADGRPAWDTADADRHRREASSPQNDERRALQQSGRYQL